MSSFQVCKSHLSSRFIVMDEFFCSSTLGRAMIFVTTRCDKETLYLSPEIRVQVEEVSVIRLLLGIYQKTKTCIVLQYPSSKHIDYILNWQRCDDFSIIRRDYLRGRENLPEFDSNHKSVKQNYFVPN